MANQRKYTDQTVLEAAKERIRYIYNAFDTPVVCFSGGKDSLVLLHLTKEVAIGELGRDKVDVVFRDEELFSKIVIDFVATYKDLPWVRLNWLCIKDMSQVYLLGKSTLYAQWDTSRKFFREPPPWATCLFDRAYDNFQKDLTISDMYKGRVCLMMGTRADESMARLRSILMKPNEPFISNVADGGSAKYKLGKPIYDFSEDDIFKYLYDNKIAYCPIYDRQMFAGQAMRVAGPLFTENVRNLDKLKQTDPELYAECLKAFPEVATQELYGKSMSKKAEIDKYAKSFDTIRQYIVANVEDRETLDHCLKVLKSAKSLHYKSPKAYPLRHIAAQFVTGRVQSKHTLGILPLGKDAQLAHEKSYR